MNHPLTELQIKDKFPGLVFVEKTHTYTVNGKILPSVSSLIKHFHKPFDSGNVAYGYAKKYGFDQKDVLDAWEGEALKATTHGTKVHLFGENYIRYIYNLGVKKKPKTVCKKALGIIQFVNDLPDYVEIIGCEIQMYNETWEYCGTCDILAYNHNNGYYILMDLKTNEELTSKYDQDPLFIIPPEYGLVQDSFGKYTCQLSFYQLLLEEIGLNIGSRIIIHLKEQEDKKLYKLYPTKNLTKEIRNWLENEKRN